jgi:hypothetical protein
MLPGATTGGDVVAAWADATETPATATPVKAQRVHRPRVDPAVQRTGYATEWVIVAA